MAIISQNSKLKAQSSDLTLRSLNEGDRAALEGLLMRAPTHNVFHLSALAEHDLSPAPEAHGGPWAVGAFRGDMLAGVLIAQRGTGCIYHTPGDTGTLSALASAVTSKATGGLLSLLSGHVSQVAPLLPLVNEVGVSRPDRCYFRTLRRGDIALSDWDNVPRGFFAPRLAGEGDIERLIDFYQVGFYSLARLPSRAAWRNRLVEQIAFRTLFLIEDTQGKVASCALSSGEGSGAAMLGGVATLPEYVGRGLSTRCVGALCAHLFSKGLTSVSLFYLQDNDAAGRVYDKLGFRDSGEWLLAALGYFGL